MLELNKIHLGNCFDLLPLIPDGSVDAVITDPPYGVLKGHRIETNVDIPRFFAECKRVMKPNAFIAFFGMMPTLPYWMMGAEEYFTYSDKIIWVKRFLTSIFTPLLRQFEEILVYKVGNPKYNITNGKYEDVKLPLLDIGLLDPNTYEKYKTEVRAMKDGRPIKGRGSRSSRTEGHERYNLKILDHHKYDENSTVNFTNVWSFFPEKLATKGLDINHPTVKPIELLKRLVELLTPEPTADYTPLILDPFIGSGTTALACQSLNRNFIGMELYPDYVEIANRRLLQARNLFTDTKFTQPTNDATMNELDAKQGEMF